jgi:hypothetical protein
MLCDDRILSNHWISGMSGDGLIVLDKSARLLSNCVK